MAADKKKIRIKLVKGLAGCKSSHRATVRGLGLKRLNHSVELIDTPEVRGMVNKVYYLVRVEG
jgi:large subunit ribosomal protein L30